MSIALYEIITNVMC